MSKIKSVIKNYFSQEDFPYQIQPLKESPPNQQLLKFTGIALLTIYAIFGICKITEGWPFACYSIFQRYVDGETVMTITPYGVEYNKERVIDLNILKQHMQVQSLTGMMNHILRSDFIEPVTPLIRDRSNIFPFQES